MSVRPGTNVAYWLFLGISLVICALDLVFFILPLGGSDLQAIAMLVSIPIILVGIPISLVAIVLSIIHRRERPLLVMSASVIVVFGALLASDEWDLVSEQTAPRCTTVPLS